MQLTAPEVARLLRVSEKQVYRWADEGDIPTYNVNGQPHFHRAELLEWATLKHLEVSPELIAGVAGERGLSELAAALAVGGVQRDVEGDDRAAVLTAIVGELTLPAGVDRDFVLQVLLAREAVASTAIGEGLAIPHVRSPVVLPESAALVCVCYLGKPVAFEAYDGKAVHTMFVVVSPTVHAHLQLLARLAAALHDPHFKQAVTRRADAEELVAAARRLEARPADAEAQAIR